MFVNHLMWDSQQKYHKSDHIRLFFFSFCHRPLQLPLHRRLLLPPLLTPCLEFHATSEVLTRLPHRRQCSKRHSTTPKTTSLITPRQKTCITSKTTPFQATFSSQKWVSTKQKRCCSGLKFIGNHVNPRGGEILFDGGGHHAVAATTV